MFYYYYLQTLNTCFICLAEDFNLPITRCCGQTYHTTCMKKWKRTLLPSARACPNCRAAFPLPASPEEVATLHGFMQQCQEVGFVFNIYETLSLSLLKMCCLYSVTVILNLFHKQQYP